MGSPIPWPVEASSCTVCWAPGKPFELFLTPHWMQVTVTGMITGILWVPGMDDPPNGFFELEWTAPCSWTAIFGLWEFEILYNAGNTIFTINHALHLNVFLGLTPPCELTSVNNNPAVPWFWDLGTASWTWIGGP